MPHPVRRAFTLVELLIVITIISVLIGLLLPAVQAAREAARRLQCQNNIKQLGLACLSYENLWSKFPPSSTWPSVTAGLSLETGGATWVILVLPQLDQQPLYDQVDFTKAMADDSSSNMFARGQQLSMMLCPSDAFNRQPFMGSAAAEVNDLHDNWARGNYGANASLGTLKLTGPSSAGDGSYLSRPFARGVMNANFSIGSSGIRDGLTNTILLGELRAGLTAYDNRGVWAMGGGSSALWGHGGASIPTTLPASGTVASMNDKGPNYSGSLGDCLPTCTSLANALGSGSTQKLATMGMGGCQNGPNAQQTARSMHVNGVYICLADGSVQWVSDFIQVTPSDFTSLSVWDRLMLSSDDQAVPVSPF